MKQQKTGQDNPSKGQQRQNGDSKPSAKPVESSTDEISSESDTVVNPDEDNVDEGEIEIDETGAESLKNKPSKDARAINYGGGPYGTSPIRPETDGFW